MLKYFYILLLLLPLSGFTKQPIHFQRWQHNDTTFSKQIGGAVRNYQRPDKAWDSIVNSFELEGDSVVYVDKSVLRTRVNKNGVSKIMLTWDDTEYTVTQKMLGIGWLKISTRQSQWIDSTMNWSNFSVDSNICKWTGVSPGVDYRVRKNNGQVEHGIFYKPAFLDSAVTLYNQRPDSLDIALANVMIYTLSDNIDDADSAIGDVPWRRLKDFGYYNFNLSNQRLRFPGCDTLPKIPVRQYWERRGTKIICIEYMMMKWIKQVHEAYPSAIVWHNDTKKIEGTTNVEDTRLRSASVPNAYGGAITFQSTAQDNALIRVKNVDTELGVGATISACVCSLYVTTVGTQGDISAYSIFKPWLEGNQDNANCVDPGCSWEDWSCDTYEWTTGGCGSADDGGSDNSGDGTGADRKATAEDIENVTAVDTWYAWNMSAALAQAWYDGTKNEEGIALIQTTDATVLYVSTEGASNQPFWVFTYTTGAAAVGQMIMIQP